MKLNVSHSVISTPEAVFARGDRDHAPTALSLGRGVRSVASVGSADLTLDYETY